MVFQVCPQYSVHGFCRRILSSPFSPQFLASLVVLTLPSPSLFKLCESVHFSLPYLFLVRPSCMPCGTTVTPPRWDITMPQTLTLPCISWRHAWMPYPRQSSALRPERSPNPNGIDSPRRSIPRRWIPIQFQTFCGLTSESFGVLLPQRFRPPSSSRHFADDVAAFGHQNCCSIEHGSLARTCVSSQVILHVLFPRPATPVATQSRPAAPSAHLSQIFPKFPRELPAGLLRALSSHSRLGSRHLSCRPVSWRSTRVFTLP